MRVLTFTTLYPNAAQPNHAIFVENRIRHLAGQRANGSASMPCWMDTAGYKMRSDEDG